MRFRNFDKILSQVPPLPQDTTQYSTSYITKRNRDNTQSISPNAKYKYFEFI